jgi:ABC-type transport system involved in multi-copper enzyme maturation permease subunit
MKKDARHLLMPWALLVSAALLSFVRLPAGNTPLVPVDFSWLIPLVAFLGIPLLAAMIFGDEFQHRTFALLLTQPVERRRIWAAKLLLSAIAVAIPTLVLWMASSDQGRDYRAVVLLWAALTVVSTPFWTMLTRFTLGAMVLNIGANSMFWMLFEYCRQYFADNARALHALPWVSGAVLVLYGGAVLAMGRRMMEHYQATDGAVPADFALPGSQALPDFFVDAFRARPKGAWLNLVRREFWLLRLVWFLGTACAAGWAIVIRVLHVPTSGPNAALIACLLLYGLGIVTALLAGTLSLGEEKSWGTHAWHMTLPLSATTQWLTKLGVALFSSIVAAALMPTGVIALLGRNFAVDFRFPAWLAVLEAALLTLAGFWCASIVKGTVRAIVWVFPLLIGMGMSFALGNELFQWLGAEAVQRLIFRFLNPALSPSFIAVLYRFDLLLLWLSTGFFVALSATALVQSRRRFALETAERKLPLLAAAVPLLSITLLGGVLAHVPTTVEFAIYRNSDIFLADNFHAVNAFEKALPEAEQAKPQHISSRQFDAALDATGSHNRWLRGASISVTPTPGLEWNEDQYRPGMLWRLILRKEMSMQPYTAELVLASGKHCAISYFVRGGKSVLPDIIRADCR